MARRSPSVVVVCTNVAQAGRIAQGLGTGHGHEESVHHPTRSGPRSTRPGQSGSVHHHDMHGPRATRGTLGAARSPTTGTRSSTGAHRSTTGAHRSTTGAHRSTTGAHSSTTGAHSSTGTRRATAVRVWKVYHDITLYKVQDLGTRLEATSEEDGSTVWRGQRLPNGDGYYTQSTTLATHQLASFLGLVRDGDQTTPGAQGTPASAHRAAPASADRARQRAPTARAQRTTQKPATTIRTEAPHAERSVPTPKKRGRPKKAKPPASTPPKSKGAASAQPKSTRSASARPKSKASASATPKSKSPTNTKPKSKRSASPSQRQPPKAKATAKRKPAAKATAGGPATSRSPGSPLVTPAYMRQRLHAKHPDTTEAVLATMEAIWRGGASDPTRAWMLAQGIPDVVDAFVDWVEHHATEANEYMRAAHAQRAA
jgi:hypothetical protein